MNYRLSRDAKERRAEAEAEAEAAAAVSPHRIAPCPLRASREAGTADRPRRPEPQPELRLKQTSCVRWTWRAATSGDARGNERAWRSEKNCSKQGISVATG